MVLAIELEDVTRHLGNKISRDDVDVVVDTGHSGQRAVIGAVAAAVNRLGALVGRIQESVIAADTPMPPIFGDLQFKTIAVSLAEIEEITKSGLLRGDKEQIVVILAKKVVGTPV